MGLALWLFLLSAFIYLASVTCIALWLLFKKPVSAFCLCGGLFLMDALCSVPTRPTMLNVCVFILSLILAGLSFRQYKLERAVPETRIGS